jgi:protein required for attachment to host cells
VERAGAPLREVEGFVHLASRAKTQDLTSDRQGRSLGTLGCNMDYDVTPKRQQALVFAKELSERLKIGRRLGQFARLYIAAAPAFLGLLRRKLDGKTSELIAGEVCKDLTQLQPALIRRHLPQFL